MTTAYPVAENYYKFNNPNCLFSLYLSDDFANAQLISAIKRLPESPFCQDKEL